MAELGLAASGLGIVSLALQVGDCIVRLKRFWAAVKEAPAEIGHLIEEIETLSVVLADFESDQPSNSKCMVLCRKAVTILNGVATEAEAEIGKRRVRGSVKAVLKRDVLQKLGERLARAQGLLMLSNQIYSLNLLKRNQQAHHDWAQAHQNELKQLRELVSQQPYYDWGQVHQQELQHLKFVVAQSTETIVSTVEQSAPYPRSKLSSSTKPEDEPKGLRMLVRGQRKLKARLQTPKWLFGISRAVELYESRAQAGWDFNIQVYNIVPSESPIFRMAGVGDITGVRELFVTGKASPFDRDENGLTVLDVAAYNQEPEVCRLLKSQGANANISRESSALIMACKSGYASNTKEFLALIQFLAEDVELIDPFESVRAQDGWINFRGAAEVLVWILKQSNSTYRERTLEERVLFTIRICQVAFQYNMAGLVRTILLGQEFDAQLCQISDKRRSTLLHCAAWNLGERYLTAIVQSERLEDHLGLICDLIVGGSELQTLTLGGRTPLLEVFSGLLYSSLIPDTNPIYFKLSASTSNVILPIQLWLKQLQSCGVELEVYGKEERRVLECPQANREFEYAEATGGEGRRRRISRLRLIGFDFGTQIEDWFFWLAPVVEDSFVEFFDTLEHPERAIPGAWSEDYPDDEVEYENDNCLD